MRRSLASPTRSQGEAAFLRRQRGQVRSGKPAGRRRRARVIPVRVRRRSKDDQVTQPLANLTPVELAEKIENGSLHPRIAPTGDAQNLARRIAELEDGDRQMLTRVAQGQSDHEIAVETWIPLKTIRIERRRIIRHLHEGEAQTVRVLPAL
jgi:FixJ family two-component response regulator